MPANFKKSLIAIVVSTLVGCGGGGTGPTIQGPTASIVEPTVVINQFLKPNDLVLDCNTTQYTSVIPANIKINPEYGYENNSWGAWGLYGRPAMTKPWTQCIGMGFSGTNTVVAKWIWDFGENVTNTVKSYPEIVFGYKPTSKNKDISPLFPKVINTINAIDVNWDIEIERGNGSGWMLIESWLSHTDKAVSLKSGDVMLELAIIFDCWNTEGWCHYKGEVVNIGKHNYTFTLHPAPIPGNPHLAAFHSVNSLAGQNSIDLKQFLNFLRDRKIISDFNYVNSIEFGTEIQNGKGQVRVNSYSVTVK